MKKVSVLVFAMAIAACTLFDKVMTDIQIGCESEALAASVIPTGTPVAIVANDLAAACDVADALIPTLENIVATYENKQVADGTAPAAGKQYAPAPWALPKIAARRAAKK